MSGTGFRLIQDILKTQKLIFGTCPQIALDFQGTEILYCKLVLKGRNLEIIYYMM